MPDHIKETGLTMIASLWQSIQPTINELIVNAQDQAYNKVDLAKKKAEEAIENQVLLEQENERLDTCSEAARNDFQQQLEALQNRHNLIYLLTSHFLRNFSTYFTPVLISLLNIIQAL